MHAALHDAEKTVAVARPERRLGPLCPAHRQAHRLRRLRFGCGVGGAFVEGTSDGRLQQILDLAGTFRRKTGMAPGPMRAEGEDAGRTLRESLAERREGTEW